MKCTLLGEHELTMRMQLSDFVVCWSVLVREPNVSIYLMFAIGSEVAYEVPWP